MGTRPKSPAPSTVPPASNFGTVASVNFLEDFKALQVLAARAPPLQKKADRLARREIANRRLTPSVYNLLVFGVMRSANAQVSLQWDPSEFALEVFLCSLSQMGVA